MGIGPLIAWRRASLDNLQAQLPLAGRRSASVAAVGAARALGVGQSSLVLLCPDSCSWSRTIALGPRSRGHRARRAAATAGRCRRLGACCSATNRRYGGFVVHLADPGRRRGRHRVAGLVAAHRDHAQARRERRRWRGYRVRFDGLREEPRSPTTARSPGASRSWTVAGPAPCWSRPRSSIRRSSRRSPTWTTGSASWRTSTWSSAISPATARTPRSRCRSTAWCPGSGSAASSSRSAPVLAILPERRRPA